MNALNPYAAPRADVTALALAAEDLPLAGPGARLGAQVLNLLLYAPALMIVAVGAFLDVAAHQVGAPHPPRESSAHQLIWTGVGVAAAVFLFQIFFVAVSGQSLGKKWVGIRVVKTDGLPVTFTRACILRFLLPALLTAVPLVGLLFALVDLLFVFRDDHRCLHDLIAGTKVVEAPRA